MSYSSIQLAGGGGGGEEGEDLFFSPLHSSGPFSVDDDDAAFFDFGSSSHPRLRPPGGGAGTGEKDGKSSQLATGFNFVNSIVGAGIIGIPVAIKECGFFMGIVLLVLVAYLVDQSVILLIDCGVQANKTNFEGEWV
jgi:hypothetical protein